MKAEVMFFRLLLHSSLAYFFIPILCSNLASAQAIQICNDRRAFYTKFLGDDTSVFITQRLFERTPGLYSMSAADSNGNEIDCKTASFRFILMRKNEILYASSFDTVTLTTLDTLRENIKKYGAIQGDILIFTDIKIKHPYTPRYCYHDGLPMLKVIDNQKTYPRRMYMNVKKYLERNSRREKNKNE
ncbi:hypothetical protein [Algoriphagus sp. Y33]|uniref:hypothetical protein n=1 Tax=Algoriphagus sp. Y33 TaxID=2772483 RepID=UPI00177CC16E|nr:hypothetical protein [Algoriphagus sp. Y33]